MKVSRASHGLTLIEVTIALLVMSMMGAMTYRTIAHTIDAKNRASQITDRYHQIRQAMLRMSRELNSAYLSMHRDCSDPRSRTMFVGKRSGFASRLEFNSFSHQKLIADAKESDQNELAYYLERAEGRSGANHLYRFEKLRIDERFGKGGDGAILCEDIVKLSFEFYDPKQDRWVDEWDSSRPDTKDQLPKFVRIELIADMGQGRKEKFVTKTRIMMNRALSIPGLGVTPCID